MTTARAARATPEEPPAFRPPITPYGRGFLPKILRALTNAVLAYTWISVDHEQVGAAKGELGLALENGNDILGTEILSTETQAKLAGWRTTASGLRTSLDAMTTDEAKMALTEFVQRTYALAADLDTELLGLTRSDGGSTP